MAKITDVTFTGASNAKYVFKAYPLNTSFRNVGGIYIFTTGIRYTPLYVGKTQSLAGRIPSHNEWECVRRRGVDAICVRVETNAEKRGQIEADLIRSYQPPCNDRLL